MKYLSLLLAIYVLLLTATPNCAEDNCFQEQTSEQSQNPQNEKDCSDCCSPFMRCKTCFGFTFPIISFPVRFTFTYSDKKVSIYKEISTSDFFSSIWQPPEMG
ncbi:MAG: hypothetical protein ACKVTZ_10095 [Bacteroidia bacterium]